MTTSNGIAFTAEPQATAGMACRSLPQEPIVA